MTALQLLALITAALLLQLAVGVGVVLRRRRAAPPAQALPLPPAEPKGDRAWEGWRDFRVVRRVFEDPAHTQCSFYLQPVDGQPLPDFRPGQFLTFSLDVAADEAAARRSVTRCYSLSDRPEPTQYRVTIKRVPAPPDHPEWPAGLSSNHFHDRVQVGDILPVRAPSGHFFIDPDPSVPVVLIGGGIGITPMMSMARWCAGHQPERSVHLYYGVRNGEELAFKAELEDLASRASLRRHVVFSRPAPGENPGVDYQHAGHVDLDLLRRTLPHGRHAFYLCGPSALMQALVPALVEWGVPEPDVHFEAFGPASVKLPREARPAAATEGLELKFQRSGRTLTWTGQDDTLLDFAERHGIELPSGCRSGGCGSCETRLLRGTVAYERTPDHDVAPGHCLLCVGRPTSPLVLEA